MARTSNTEPEQPRKEGLRERKRRETLQRIAETGLKLFLELGYDATTLEAIAAASGISPRTFFHYFKTKDEILQYWQGEEFFEALRPLMLEESTQQAPLDAAFNCLLKLTELYEDERSIMVDRIMQSSNTLKLRKQTLFVEMEEGVFTALIELWPEPGSRPALKIAAMVAIGTMRLAVEEWRRESGQRPLAYHFRATFALLNRVGIAAI
ncbi:TetR family transcriptional regulator [Paramixta manurensis]|uniref:TetR family transcriptional regulator n=1 Tax=Paramixta manurensis TaxID=2740817 RepID=A0A6M8UFY8_9GAMM|nr:TetR family transcriptional regulator [Erwiniaceae bacterium PD-1]